MPGPYRLHPEWKLSSEHRVSPFYRGAFVCAALFGLFFVGWMARSMMLSDRASSVGVWVFLACLVAMTGGMLFVAIRASAGRVGLHQEGVVFDDVLGRTSALPWNEVIKVTRLHRSGGHFMGWSLARRDGTRMLVAPMFAGVGPPLELLARTHGLPIEDEAL